MIEDDAAIKLQLRLIPARAVDELAAKNRILSDDRIRIFDGVTDPQVTQQDRRRDQPAIDAALQTDFALQESNAGGLYTVLRLPISDYADRMQLQPLIFRYERNWNLACSIERPYFVNDD